MTLKYLERLRKCSSSVLGEDGDEMVMNAYEISKLENDQNQSIKYLKKAALYTHDNNKI